MQLETDGIVFRHDGKIYLNDSASARRSLSSYGVLTRDERLQEIANSVTARRSVRISTLSTDLRVTATTIRSDLKELSRRGIVDIHHGYAAVPNLNSSGDSIHTAPVRTTEVITSRALSHIESGDTVFLDDSSFSRHLAGTIDQARDLTIITNSLEVATLLSRREYPCETITLSGRIGPGSLSIEPFTTQSVLEKLSVRKVVFGLSYLSQNGTFLLENPIPHELLVGICERSMQVFLCARSENIGTKILSDADSLSRISKMLHQRST